MSVAFLFPGQGAQYPGMARDLYDHSAAVRELFDTASDIAKKPMNELLFDGSEADLKQTDNTQIAITLANLSAKTVLEEFGVTSERSAGFSLGEYAAFVDAGVLTPAAAFRLVLHRGEIMERTSRTLDDDSGSAGMVAAMGKDLPEIVRILADGGVNGAYPSLHNSPVQTVVGGRADALARAAATLKEGGVRRVVPLNVSGPFHTPLMQPARSEFSAIARDFPFSDPTHPVYSNVTGETVASGEEARTLCVNQLVRTVLWTKEERTLRSDGVDILLEVGPGRVLQGLWKAVGKVDDTWPTDRFRTAGTVEEIEAIAKEISHAD